MSKFTPTNLPKNPKESWFPSTKFPFLSLIILPIYGYQISFASNSAKCEHLAGVSENKVIDLLLRTIKLLKFARVHLR